MFSFCFQFILDIHRNLVEHKYNYIFKLFLNYFCSPFFYRFTNLFGKWLQVNIWLISQCQGIIKNKSISNECLWLTVLLSLTYMNYQNRIYVTNIRQNWDWVIERYHNQFIVKLTVYSQLTSLINYLWVMCFQTIEDIIYLWKLSKNRLNYTWYFFDYFRVLKIHFSFIGFPLKKHFDFYTE